MSEIVHAEGIVKRYGDLIAVDRLSFEVRRGECFGFLGPNGAGKTTTMRMIFGLTPVTEGRLEVFGLSVNGNVRGNVRGNIREIKRRIGVAPQELSLDPDLRVIENLLIYSRYFDLPKRVAEERAEELLRFFHLEDKRKEPIDRLSGGMKRRLLIARALINRPELLILDEPTTGLDPQTRHVMWDRIRTLGEEGVTTILTTHYMEEAAVLCTRIVVMDEGRILEEGSPGDLVQKHGTRDLEEVFLKLTGKELRE